jgi:hypothetical protein
MGLAARRLFLATPMPDLEMPGPAESVEEPTWA